jgi:hypothetical protein
MSDDVSEVVGTTPDVPDHLNPIQRALYQRLMSTTGLLLQAGFAVNDVVSMVRRAAKVQKELQRSQQE